MGDVYDVRATAHMRMNRPREAIEDFTVCAWRVLVCVVCVSMVRCVCVRARAHVFLCACMWWGGVHQYICVCLVVRRCLRV